MKDAGTVDHEHISLAKRNNVWMALETARLARDILAQMESRKTTRSCGT